MKRKALEKNTVAELRQIARNVGLKGASRMRKAELVAALSSSVHGETVKAGADKPASANGGKKSGSSRARKSGSRRGGGKKQDTQPAISPWLKRTFSRVSVQGEQRAKVSKYYLGVPESAELEERFEYPETYGENAISLMVRDPYWLFTYWEFSPDLRQELVSRIGEEALLRSRTVLRVYDVTGTDPDRAAGHYDIDIAPEARNWYINVARVEREYCVDIGLIAPDGSFITIARSNRVSLPPVGPSDEIDEEWVAIDALSDLYVLVDSERGGTTSGSGGWGSGGFGR